MNTIQTSSRFDVALQVSQQRQSNETTSSFATLLQSKTQPAKEIDEADLAIQEKIDKEIAEWKDMLQIPFGMYSKLRFEQKIENLQALQESSAENRATWNRIKNILEEHDPNYPYPYLEDAAQEMILAGAGDIAEQMIQDAIANNHIETLERLFSASAGEQSWEAIWKMTELGEDNPKYQEFLSHQKLDIFTSTTRNGILQELSEMFTDNIKDLSYQTFKQIHHINNEDESEKQNIESSIQSLLAIIQDAHNSFAERNLAFVENQTQEFLARFGAK